MQKFFTGDVVKYIGKDRVWKPNSEMIIHETVYRGGGKFEYSTDHGAWFNEKDFELIRKADKKSFAALDKSIQDEGDYE